MAKRAGTVLPQAPSAASELAATLRLDAIGAQVRASLAAAGVGPVLLKGRAFAQLLYDSAGDRPYSDVDLLVSPHQIDRAERTLAQCGFARVDRDEEWMDSAPQYAHTFHRASDGALVDLHWSLPRVAASPNTVWTELGRHLVTTEVGGYPATTLDPSASALLVALHNAHHGTHRPMTLRDLDQAVQRLELPVWQTARDLADRLGALASFASGLRLSPQGSAIADRLGLPSPASVELWLKTHDGVNGARVLDSFLSSSARQRLVLARKVLMPTPTVMRKFVPLARRGWVGLTLAYSARLLALASHAPRALGDWRRAKLAVSDSQRRGIPMIVRNSVLSYVRQRVRSSPGLDAAR